MSQIRKGKFKGLLSGLILAIIGGGGFAYYNIVAKYIENDRIKKNVKIYRDIGNEYFMEGDFKKANEVYSLALMAKLYDSKTYKKYAENLVYLAVKTKMEQETAKEMCKLLIRRRIDTPTFHHLLGAIYIGEGDFKKALAELESAEIGFEKVENKKFNQGKLLFTWGYFHSRQNDIENSIIKYEKAITFFLDTINEIKNGKVNLNIDFVKKCLGETYANLGNILEKHEKRYSEAIEQYKNAEKVLLEIKDKYKERLPQLADVYNKWGINIYMSLREKDVEITAAIRNEIINEAIEYFQKSIKSDKEKTTAFYNLACMYSQLENYDKSIEIIQVAINKGFQSIEALKKDTCLNADLSFFEDNRLTILGVYKRMLSKLSAEENFSRAQILNKMGIFCMLTRSFHKMGFNYFAKALEIYKTLGISTKVEETSKNIEILTRFTESINTSAM